MSFYTTLATLSCLLGAASSSNDWIFDFANKGFDFDQAIPPFGWTGINRCGEPENQSPINLMHPVGMYGWVYGALIPQECDDLMMNYKNPRNGFSSSFVNKNLEFSVGQLGEHDEGQESYLQSQLPAKLYATSATHFKPTSFHFHHPTEHSIDGKHEAVALHLSHGGGLSSTEGGDPALLEVGVQFSIDNFYRIISQEEIMVISDFLEALSLDKERPSNGDLSGVDFEEFMHAIDLQEAWIYSGSATFPPCVKPVFWRIARRVYPIEFKHFYLIRQIYLDHHDELKATTNIRGIHQVNGHDVYFIGGQQLSTSVQALLLAVSLLLYSMI